jgi:hypothetical protein
LKQTTYCRILHVVGPVLQSHNISRSTVKESRKNHVVSLQMTTTCKELITTSTMTICIICLRLTQQEEQFYGTCIHVCNIYIYIYVYTIYVYIYI